ncbi:MAG: hypothetical protein GF383_12495 [Candidatus Lokiarchaeota archaeon]|nr:hypothetical protein [Candidatus Lokiarchaeota archaeon]MBD3341844.1 hypothetical protein [Candidatus Lokiarchaeota archaeon]
MFYTSDNKLYFKIIYYGMGGSGKTTILDTLYQITRTYNKSIIPIGDITKIDKASGATLYFDKGLFESTRQNQIYYQIFTVAGQTSYAPLRKKVYEGSDGIVFVVDSQVHRFKENVESLKELMKFSHNSLIKEIPVVVMLNKQDLPHTISSPDFKAVLMDLNLWYDPEIKYNLWNPSVFETCALYPHHKNIFESFTDCARKTALYQFYGKGKAPIDDNVVKRMIKYGFLKKEPIPTV